MKFTGYSWGLVGDSWSLGRNADDADASNADLSGFNYRTCYTRVKICANNTTLQVDSRLKIRVICVPITRLITHQQNTNNTSYNTPNTTPSPITRPYTMLYIKLFLLLSKTFLLNAGFSPKFSNNPTSILVALK